MENYLNQNLFMKLFKIGAKQYYNVITMIGKIKILSKHNTDGFTLLDVNILHDSISILHLLKINVSHEVGLTLYNVHYVEVCNCIALFSPCTLPHSLYINE